MSLPLLSRLSLVPRTISHRSLHKGVDSTPPLRFIALPEKAALYLAIATTFLSYPTYVLLNLKNLRPLPPNSLNAEVQEQIDAARAARMAQ